MLNRQKAAGAAESGLDLVDDEQRAVLAAELCRAAQIAVVGNVDALALDWLDDEGREPARREHALQRRKIVERHLDAIRQERPKPLRNMASALTYSAP